MKNLIVLISIVILVGCATSVPVHEASTPETLGSWGFQFGGFAGSSPILGSLRDDITVNKNKTTIIGSGYGIGLPWGMELDLESFGSGTSAGGVAGLKVQWMGQNKFNAANGNLSQTTVIHRFTSVASDSKMSDFSSDSPYYSGSLDATGISVAHIVGYRPVSWIVFYVGPKYISGEVKADYKAVQDGPVVLSEKRNFWMGGGIIGFGILRHSKNVGFDIIFEYQRMNVPAVFKDDRETEEYTTLSMALPFSFGS